jgi:hypothetical protein
LYPGFYYPAASEICVSNLRPQIFLTFEISWQNLGVPYPRYPRLGQAVMSPSGFVLVNNRKVKSSILCVRLLFCSCRDCLNVCTRIFGTLEVVVQSSFQVTIVSYRVHQDRLMCNKNYNYRTLLVSSCWPENHIRYVDLATFSLVITDTRRTLIRALINKHTWNGMNMMHIYVCKDYLHFRQRNN